MKLQQHAEEKRQAVRGWDIVSAGLGLTGFALIMASIANPGAKINAIRLPAAFGMMLASVGAEQLRSTDLLSLNETINFQKAIKTEKIKKDTLLRETIDDLQTEEELFQSVPVDRWTDLAQRTGIAPPNLEARSVNANPAMTAAEMPEPPVQGAATATMEPDPCADGYDPEDASPESEVFQDCLVFAANVEAWFAERGDEVPGSLIAEWRKNPGIAIKVTDGIASIVRGQDHA